MVLLHSPRVELGSVAPDFSLPATDGNTYSLNSFGEKKLWVVLFLSNHCPYVQAVRDRIISLANEFTPQEVQFLAISANNAQQYPEDSFENMKLVPFPFPYLYDESQETARTYGAVCTPDIFVYDHEKKLIYRGRIDDNWQDPENVTNHELHHALTKGLEGKTIPLSQQHPSMGCSIKWKG